jgi:stearoyl-CoA desaturase (delta-9 desaturase)
MTTHTDDHHDDIVYPAPLPFILLHLAAFGAIFTGVTAEALVLCVALYFLRIFAIGAGYHRYFSHRSYSTSRAFQFVLAVLAQSSVQKSVLWWANKHRLHHLHSDTEHDVHSPRRHGFFHAHVGWIFAPDNRGVDMVKVADLARYPELVWLHRLALLPGAVLALVCWLIAGWAGLVVGFVWSTLLVYHATFAINSVAHLRGRKRYVTGDDSRNNWVLALVTMGEGWHNNHHAFQSSVRQGFRWWEIDPTFYLLKALSWLGLVWDLKSPPEAVLRNEHKLGTRVIERAAAKLIDSFPIDQIAANIQAALSRSPYLEELRERLAAGRHWASDRIGDVHLPPLPSREELRRRAAAMFARTRSLEEIVDRAHRMLLEAIGARLPAPSSGAA